nr:hypothetical protein [Candidatus Mycoplasma haematolamae]
MIVSGVGGTVLCTIGAVWFPNLKKNQGQSQSQSGVQASASHYSLFLSTIKS